MPNKKPPKLQLTPEQKRTIAEIRRLEEENRPNVIAEHKRMAETAAANGVKLRSVFTMLKGLRQTKNVTLAALSELTGISKPALSRLENDPEPNVTLTTLSRVAEALGCELVIAVVEKTGPVTADSQVAVKLTKIIGNTKQTKKASARK